MATILNVSTVDALDSLSKSNANKAILIHFWESWAPQCEQLNNVLEELCRSTSLDDIVFAKIEAESVPELSLKYNVTAVPTCLLLKNGKEIERINGVNIPQLRSVLQKYQPTDNTITQDVTQKIEKLLKSSPVMLFMKGSPDAPKCGFSRTMIEILNEQDVKFTHFDILTDEAVRQGLKEYSNWPTYPQLYAKGELVGGLDIVKELVKSGEFKSALQQDSSETSTDERLKALVNRGKVMLFMKGSPDAPRCGFSKSIVGLLQTHGVSYEHFDILTDNFVREQLKIFSNWPTYPQLYINGELVGGLDIVKQLAESGELQSMLKT